MAAAQKNWLDPHSLHQHSVDLRQFMDVRAAVLPNGMRILEAYNGSGLSFTLLPDRGLDIWTAHYNGMPLTWVAQGAPYPPDMGQNWLRQFNGGLLVTCGLRHAGPPGTDPVTGESFGLHGLYTYLRAGDVAVTHHADENAVTVRGVVAQSALFGEQLRLEREYRIELGKPEITLVDQVTNVGDAPSPLMVLYHCNLGYPLVRAGTELVTNSTVHPRDDVAREGAATWNHYEAASAGYAEQVFFHHQRGANGTTGAALVNEDFGLLFEWETHSLPYLTQWKNTRQGIYVSGIEPGNCIPEGQTAARDAERLQMLAPGSSAVFNLSLRVLDGPDAVQSVRQQIDGYSEAVAGCNLTGYPRI